MDSARGDPSGSAGRALREAFYNKIEKWQEPPPAKQPKPLPVPDSEPKKKRGGRRVRKMKERLAYFKLICTVFFSCRVEGMFSLCLLLLYLNS